MSEQITKYLSDRRAALNEMIPMKKRITELEGLITRLENGIMQEMSQSGDPYYENPQFSISILQEIKPHADDWDAIWKHIAATEAFELLHKRITESAVRERWAEGVEIPGISRFPVFKLKITEK